MFRVKVCGLTTVENAIAIADSGIDAIGLNFYPKSKRYVAPDIAAEIVDAIPESILPVGLFVNASRAEILETLQRVPLELVQLHGDETPDFLASLEINVPVMRAFRMDEKGLAPIVDYLAACRTLECLPRMTLIDAFVQGAYGGTGHTADWRESAKYGGEPWHPPLVLAGGLKPDNVADAIRAVRPHGVDTAGGVEQSPGIKDVGLVRRFAEAAHRGFVDAKG